MTVETLKPEEGFLDKQQDACQGYEQTSNGSSSSDCKEEEVCLEGPYDRMLGDTEHNWCRAVGGGTGITVLGFLFSRPLDLSSLQTAIDVVQVSAPYIWWFPTGGVVVLSYGVLL